MRESAHYDLFIDPHDISELFGSDTPFNLEQDLKALKKTIKPPSRLTDEIIHKCLKKEPRAILAINNDDGDHKNMIRIEKYDVQDDASKKSYRFIMLVDDINHYIILLHAYEKSKKDDLTEQEKKAVRTIVSNYAASCR